MKVKTFTDKRTLEEKYGGDYWTFENDKLVKVTTKVKVKPPPVPHIFDLHEDRPSSGNYTPEFRLVLTLFLNYEYFKSHRMPEFTVQAFLQYHEVTKEDITTVKRLSYEIGRAYNFEKVDALRPEIFALLDTYQPAEPADRPELERMFNKAGDLKKLVKLLTNKGYLENGNVWTRQPVEFAAMAKVCEPLLHKSYTEKPTALHRAWTGYFKTDSGKPIVSVQYFKPVKWPELLPHEQKFAWISFDFDIE